MYTFVAISTVAEPPPPAAVTTRAELLTSQKLNQCNEADKQVWHANQCIFGDMYLRDPIYQGNRSSVLAQHPDLCKSITAGLQVLQDEQTCICHLDKQQA